MKVLLERLGQESTWRGLVAIGSAFGISVNPDLTNQIIATALGIIGIINVSKKD